MSKKILLYRDDMLIIDRSNLAHPYENKNIQELYLGYFNNPRNFQDTKNIFLYYNLIIFKDIDGKIKILKNRYGREGMFIIVTNIIKEPGIRVPIGTICRMNQYSIYYRDEILSCFDHVNSFRCITFEDILEMDLENSFI